MNDIDTLRTLLNFFYLRERKGGSNNLLVEHFKYPFSTIEGRIQATPELANFLWSGCIRLSKKHPNIFQFSDLDFKFSDDLSRCIGTHGVSDSKLSIEDLLQTIGNYGESPNENFPSNTDISWLKTGLNRYFQSGHKLVRKKELEVFAISGLEVFRLLLKQWQKSAWITILSDPVSSSRDEVIIEIENYIDSEGPAF